MAKHKFSDENQPDEGSRKPRGKGGRTKILEALKRAGKDEDGFYDLLVSRSFDPEDSFSFKELLARLAPLKKSVMPSVEFEFNKAGTPAEQVAQILDAISEGFVPPDVGNMIISSVKNAVEIEANTDLKHRIEALENMING
jgi:hypothetical protein